MKFAIASLVFILALSIAPKSVAAGGGSEGGHGNKADHHKELGKKMNSLFPEKQQDTSHSTRPEVVKLTTPKFLGKVSGATAKLEWTAVQGASSYHVQVATDPNFKWLIAENHSVKGTTFEATSLEADKKYYWRVASVKGENDSMFTKSLFVSSAFTTQK